MENKLSRLLKREGTVDPLESINLFLKPKKALRKVSVASPTSQKIQVVASSPREFISDKVTEVFKGMQKMYGNIPLWIEYSMLPISVAWNLGSVKGGHNINAYGGTQYVKEFMSRLSNVLSLNEINSTDSAIQVLTGEQLQSQSSVKTLQSNDKLMPAAVQSNTKQGLLSSNILGASGLIAGLAGIALAMSYFSSKGGAKNKKPMATRQEALDTAIKSVAQVSPTSPVLEGEEYAGNNWQFDLSGYRVEVNKEGKVTEIRKVK